MKDAKMMKFDHIGIFVKDLNYGYDQLSKLIEIDRKSQVYSDPLLHVLVQFCFDNNGVCYEIVSPYGENNPVDTVLKRGVNILNHIAYKTSQFDDSVLKFRDAGCIPLGKPQPAVAFNGARVIFFLTPLKLIIELVEDIHGKN